MTAGELAAVVVAVVTLAVAGALGVVTVLAVGALRQVRSDARRLHDAVDDAVAELDAVVGRAEADLQRADSVLAAVEEVTDRVDAASELAYETFSKPVIKAVSFGSGTARAARRLRRKD